MTTTVGQASRSRGNGSELGIVGGFGWPEEPAEIETCSQADCDGDQIAATDLYCATHDRFLPLVRDWGNSGRVIAIVTGAAVIYACFALAAESNSWLPLFAVYAVIGLAAVGLPLRLFPFTVRIATLLWVLACAVAMTYHLTSSGPHTVLVTVLIIAAVCGLGLHSGVLAVGDAFDERAVRNDDHRPRAVLGLTTGAFVVSASLTIAGLSLVLVPRSLSVDAAQLVPTALITAALVLGLGLLVASAAGLVDGAPRISSKTAALRRWRGAKPRQWRATRTTIRRRRIHTIVDRMGDVLRRALIRLADAVRILSVAFARTAANFLLDAVRILVNCLIEAVNFVLKLIILSFRVLVAGAKSAWWLCSNAAKLMILYVVYAIAAAGLPIAALFVAAACTSASAGQTLSYLISGSLVSLLRFGLLAALGIAALTTAWVILASQRTSRSLQSARRSASIAAPYGLLLMATGGWIVGLPGTFGHGRIHVGWVTLISTAGLAIAFAWSQFTNKPQDDSQTDPVYNSKAGLT